MRIPNSLGLLVEQLKEVYPTDFPEIQCRRARGRRGSSGKYYSDKNKICLSLGRSPNDRKVVMLHEFAHSLCRKESHSRRFWETAFDLFEKFGINMNYARRREKGYKVCADIVSRERLGLGERKRSRKRRIIDTVRKLNLKPCSIIDYKIDTRGGAWAVVK